MRPPSMRASSLEIDSPSPVPPYLRLVVPSACWNASKIISSFPAGMPMPVSRTAKATSPSTRPTCRVTPPVAVNFTALASRLRSTCWSRWVSVMIVDGTLGPISTASVRPFSSACGPSACSRSPSSSASTTGPATSSARPASIFERSRMSSMSRSRSEPAPWIVLANSI